MLSNGFKAWDNPYMYPHRSLFRYSFGYYMRVGEEPVSVLPPIQSDSPSGEECLQILILYASVTSQQFPGKPGHVSPL